MDLDHEAAYRALRTRDIRFDGRLFVGVKTTGIYCRPVCPARLPRRENLEFYRSAAAAQAAGFRPCLRCRPEVSPELAAFRGTVSTVSRALSLIELGALDGGDVEALANRVGVGARQLRRLFDAHLGASPLTVAQTRRVLLAKQLIHETQLSMTEIALASGFGSIRRFNETFHTLYQRPPSALRRSQKSTGRALGEVSVLLRYRPPYDFASILTFLRQRAIPGVEVVEQDAYARSIEIDGVEGMVHVEATAEHALRATVTFPKLNALPGIIARLRSLFDLSADPEEIAGHLALDPLLRPLVLQRPGLRVPGAWDTFELAMRAVLGQQISVRGAAALAGKLVQACGKPLKSAYLSHPGLTHVFPGPECIAGRDLRALGMPSARAQTLSSLADAVVRDPKLFSVGQSLEDATTKLCALPGVGAWTAQYIAMRALREPDAFPTADLGLRRAVAKLEGRLLTQRGLETRAETFRPWRAYAAQHLWRALLP